MAFILLPGREKLEEGTVDITPLHLRGRLEEAAPEEQTRPGTPAPPASPPGAQDRVELVRAQNLAAATPEIMDIPKALSLLSQVVRELAAADRQELRRLYHDEGLRLLCCRLSDPAGG